MSAKEIVVHTISSADAKRVVRRLHYSGSVVGNSSLHFGVFLHGKCLGAMQFGPSMFKRQMLGLVLGSTMDGFLELNRLAFSDSLPRFSESRAIGYACRFIRRKYPKIKWIISFADATQCGDGTIYRASGFVLTSIKRNTSLRTDPTTGNMMQRVSAWSAGRQAEFNTWPRVAGHQLRYIKFLDPAWAPRLAVPMIPFDRIKAAGATMYRGKKL